MENDTNILEKIAAYVIVSQEIIDDQQARIKDLQKIAACGTCGGKKKSDGSCTKCGDDHKADSEKKASLNHEVVEVTVDKIVKAGFLKESNRQQALQAIQDDAAGSLLNFIDKLAEQRIESNSASTMMPKLGHAVPTGQESTSSQSREADRAFEQCFDNLVVD